MAILTKRCGPSAPRRRIRRSVQGAIAVSMLVAAAAVDTNSADARAIEPNPGGSGSKAAVTRTVAGPAKVGGVKPASALAAAAKAGPAGPGLPPLTPDYSVATGAGGTATTVLSTRAKLTIHAGKAYIAVYLNPTYRAGNDGIVPLPATLVPKHPLSACQYYGSLLGVDAYVLGPGPKGRPYGKFPDVGIRALAFGVIPISATLRIAQLVDAKGIVPLRGDQVTTVESDRVTGATGCDPKWRSEVPAEYSTISGPVNLTVTDVRVDGEPVDVGNDCHSRAPIRLNAHGIYTSTGAVGTGYVPYVGGIAYQRPSSATLPGSVYPLYPNASALTIPAFTGCRGSSGEDVSRLLTNAVSGSGNQLAVHQGTTQIDGLDLDHPTACDPFDPTACPTTPAYTDITPP